MADYRFGWYAVRFFRRPRWTWTPTLTTHAVVFALTWGRWGVQVMRTERHPQVRAWLAEPPKHRVRVEGEADGRSYTAHATFSAPPTPRDVQALRTLCEVAAAAQRAGLLDATVNRPKPDAEPS